MAFVDTNASSPDEAATATRLWSGPTGDDDESSVCFAAMAEQLALRAANASCMLATATMDVLCVGGGARDNSSAASNSNTATMQVSCSTWRPGLRKGERG